MAQVLSMRDLEFLDRIKFARFVFPAFFCSLALANSSVVVLMEFPTNIKVTQPSWLLTSPSFLYALVECFVLGEPISFKFA